jgi:hypothetical protein
VLPVGLVVATLAVVALAVCPTSTHAGTKPAPDRLWNRGFVATAIEADSPTPFSHPGQIEIFFNAEGWYPDEIQWTSSCRIAGLPTRIGRHRIWTRRPEAGWHRPHCQRWPERRTRWLVQFFRAAPRWRLVDGRLSLTTGHSVIRLRSAHLLHDG